MTDALINEAARLMEEQIRDYERLDSACRQLSETLVAGDAVEIETRTRSGETTLLEMRARLVRIIQALTAFADARSGVRRRDDAALFERLHHADVREPLHAAAAQDERDAALGGGKIPTHRTRSAR